MSAALGMGTSVLIARNLQIEDQGRFAVFISTIFTVAQFFNLGIYSANTYYMSKNSDWRHPLTSNSFIITFFTVIAWVITTFVLSHFFKIEVFANNFLINVSFAMLTVELLLGHLQSLSLGLVNLKLFNTIEIIRKVINIILLFGIMAIGYFSLEAVVFNLLISGVLSVAVLAYYLLDTKILKPSLTIFKKSLRYGVWIYLGTLFSYLSLRIDLIMIDRLLGPRESGLYSIAVALADAIYLIPTSVGMIFFSTYAREEDVEKKWEMALLLIKKLFLFLILPLSILFLVSSELITYIYGIKFLESSLALRALIPGILILSITTQMQNFLSLMDRPFLTCAGPGVGLFINVILNIFLIPKMGIVGASIASTVSYSAWCVTSFLLSRMRVKKTKQLQN